MYRRKLTSRIINSIIPSRTVYKSSNKCLGTMDIEYITPINSFTFDDLGNYILQGIVSIDNYTYVTAYDYKGNSNSKVIVLNKNNTIINECLLDNKAHVGGITYDSVNDIIWITNKGGKISSYNRNDFINNSKVDSISTITVGTNLKNIWGGQTIAYAHIYNNMLYVGNYDDKNPILREIPILKDGSLDINNYTDYPFINYVQGIYIKNDRLYASTSRGRLFKSKINIFDFNNRLYKEEFSYKLYLPPMVEQIYLNDFNLVCVFESNAKKFRGILTDHIGDIVEFKID